MLFILSAATYRSAIKSSRRKMTLEDLPRLAHDELGLSGVMLTTDLLHGWDLPDLDRFREIADKASCPCLALVEPDAHPLGSGDAGKALAVADRFERVCIAANRLGCSAVGFTVSSPASEAGRLALSERLKPIVTRAERLDLNFLLTMGEGSLAKPEGLIDLIKQVGGFRVGALPDFQVAAGAGAPADVLRRLAPYASLIVASTTQFDERGGHKPYDLAPIAEALVSVGYDGTIAVEHRGGKDVERCIEWTRQAIQSVRAEAGE